MNWAEDVDDDCCWDVAGKGKSRSSSRGSCRDARRGEARRGGTTDASRSQQVDTSSSTTQFIEESGTQAGADALYHELSPADIELCNALTSALTKLGRKYTFKSVREEVIVAV